MAGVLLPGGSGTPNYDKMEGNRICQQIPVDLGPRAPRGVGRGPSQSSPWIDLHGAVEAGGLDAPPVAPLAVAWRARRGDLFVHWEAGARCSTATSWTRTGRSTTATGWLSCSCFFYQYFRVYGPVSFGKSTTRTATSSPSHYLPQLRRCAPAEVRLRRRLRRRRRAEEADEGGVGRRGLPAADGGPRRRVQGVHREARRRYNVDTQGGQGANDQGGTQGGDQTESRVERFTFFSRARRLP